MITVPGLAADALGSFLAARMKRKFGSANAESDRAYSISS